MAVTPTMLFQVPQQEVASLISNCIAQASSTSIVTGFATPGGIEAIAPALLTRPTHLETLVVGAATYPAFEALDELIAAGVPNNRLYVHLGHSRMTGSTKNPFARFHPMLHSKIYYMELPDSKAVAFIGSHNLTTFALTGQNGEAAVMLEGSSKEPEFDAIRRHIEAARGQARLQKVMNGGKRYDAAISNAAATQLAATDKLVQAARWPPWSLLNSRQLVFTRPPY